MSILASISDRLRLWDFQCDGDECTLPLSAECAFENGVRIADMHALTWNHNHQVVAVGGTDSKIHLVQANNGNLLTSLPSEEADQFIGDVECLSFSHSSRYLASSIGNTVKIWDLKKRNMRATMNQHRASIKSMLFSPAETVTVSGDTNGILKIWNVDSDTTSDDLVLTTGLDTSPLNCMQFIHSNHHQLACGYGNGSLALWNLETASIMRHVEHVHRGPLTSTSMSPKNDRLVATSGKDGFVHLNDLLAKPVGSDGGPAPGDHPCAAASLSVGEHVTSISFHDGAMYIAVGTLSGYVYIYDWRNPKKPICQVPGHNPHAVKHLSFQRKVATTSKVSKKSRSKDSPSTKKMSSDMTSPSLTTTTTTTVASTTPSSMRSSNPVAADSVNAEDMRVSSSSPGAVLRPPRPSATSSTPMHTSVEESDALASTTSRRDQTLPRAQSAPSSSDSTYRYADDFAQDSSQTEKEPYVPGKSFSSSASVESSRSRKPHTTTAAHSSSASTALRGHSGGRSATAASAINTSEVEDELRKAVRPVSNQQLTEAMQMLKYDIHRELQGLIKEQTRQFAIAKEEMTATVQTLSEQLQELLIANKELREENERLRHIY